MEKELIIETIICFEKKANEMINLLAKKYSLDLKSTNPFSKLLDRKSNLWRGNLNKEWTYWFHGAHCDFENKNTKQYIHASITYGTHYAVIDNFYLYEFLQTTESLKHIHKVVDSQKIIFETINNLFEEGILVDIEEIPWKKSLVLKKNHLD